MNDTIIGLDFGDCSSELCFIEDMDSVTRTGGNVHELLPPQYSGGGGGIPSVYFYSKKKGVFYGYDAMSSRATPETNRLRYLKRRLGETATIDGKLVFIDDAITEVIQYCVRLANVQLEENFRKTTNLISLSYPATYTCAQRQRLIELAEKATLEDGTHVKVCGTISEPAATALDYLAMNGKTDKETTVLTYDLGGGTFDLALVAAYPKGRKNALGGTYYYDIINHRGLDKVGGKAFDDAMYELLLEKVNEELLGDELTQREVYSIRNTVAEKAKIELSSMDVVNPEIVHDDEMLDIEVTREEFEDKTKALLRQTIRLTKDLLKDHPENKPDYILLSGGPCEMPMVEAGLKKYLKEYADRIIKYRPQLAVAAGAARYGACECCPVDGAVPKNAVKPEVVKPEVVKPNVEKPNSTKSNSTKSNSTKSNSSKNGASKTSASKVTENHSTKPAEVSEELAENKPTPPKKSPKELYDEGDKYYYGRGVMVDYVKAMECYLKSGELGYADAQFALGYCYINGKGTAKDDFKAAEWYLRAALQGHVDAQCNLGYCYEYGQGVSKDVSKAVEWYRKAAMKGQAKAQYNLGYCYYVGNGVNQDYEQAVQWFTKAAEQKDSGAQYYLGCCHEQGQSVEKDEKKAAEWYSKAAKLGHADAQYKAAYCYEHGQGVKRDTTQAFQWYQKSANQGHAEAQYRLAYCYAYGIGVAINAGQAAEWYQKSANQGHADAQYKLAYCYEHGNGVTKDRTKAVVWYRKAAVQGHADAQCNLGYCYSQGQGIAQNEIEAAAWYRKAANQGHAQAQYNLGCCYDQGRGVTKDYGLAAHWFRKAAEQGHANAQCSLGRCYDRGRGKATNESQALYWYKKAVNQGESDPRKRIKALKRKDRVFKLYSLISAILMLFVFNGGSLWETLWSVTPLGLGKATGIRGFQYSMIIFTIFAVLTYLLAKLGLWSDFDDKEASGFKAKKLALLLSIGMWYAGYGLTHTFVKMTWGYYVFATLFAIICGILMGICVLTGCFINTDVNHSLLFHERCAKFDIRFITSMLFFHVSFCGLYAMANEMEVVKISTRDRDMCCIIMVISALFSLFYAIKRIVAACAKYAYRYDKECKKNSEVVIFVLTIALTVVFFIAKNKGILFAENEMLRMLTAPCTFTLPFVLFFRFIAIVAMNKKLKK